MSKIHDGKKLTEEDSKRVSTMYNEILRNNDEAAKYVKFKEEQKRMAGENRS